MSASTRAARNRRLSVAGSDAVAVSAAGIEPRTGSALQHVAHRIPGWAWAFSLYACVAVATIGRGAIVDPGRVCVCLPGGGDPQAYMWSLAWWPHAFLHGLDPLYTHAIWAPGGANVAAATTIPAAAIALWPVTAMFGPVVSYNLLAILSPTLSGLTAYLLCRRVTGRHGASLMGGFLFGFSSYQLGQLLGHPNLTLVFLLPVMVHLGLRRVAGDLSRRCFLAALTSVFVVQALLSTEILFDVALIGGCALIVGYFTAESSMRLRIDGVAREVLVAAAIAVAVLLPYLRVALAQPQVYRGGDAFGLDALNLIMPTRVTWLGGHLFASISSTFERGDYPEAGGYLSLPLLLAFGAFTRRTWRSRRSTRALTIMLIISIVLALGSPLHIAGNRLVELPWGVLERLPLFPGVIPSRIAVFAALIMAIAVALWLSDRTGHPTHRWLIAFLGVLALLPSLGGAWWTSTPTNPGFFQNDRYQHYLTRGETVLTIPSGLLSASMLWQAESHFSFTLASGYIGAAPSGAPASGAVGQLLDGPSTISPVLPQATQLLSALLREDHVRHIIVDPRYQTAWTPLLASLARPPQRIDGILLYTVGSLPGRGGKASDRAPVLQRRRPAMAARRSGATNQ